MFETSTSDVIVLVGGALGRQSGREEVFPSGSAGKESTCNAGDAGDTGLILPMELCVRAKLLQSCLTLQPHGL